MLFFVYSWPKDSADAASCGTVQFQKQLRKYQCFYRHKSLAIESLSSSIFIIEQPRFEGTLKDHPAQPFVGKGA